MHDPPDKHKDNNRNNNNNNQLKPMESINFSSADQYIESNPVRSLNVSGRDVHAALWPTFKQLLETTDAAAGWKYESAFNYARDSVTKEYNVKCGDILEDNHLQCRVGFYFIMHLYH